MAPFQMAPFRRGRSAQPSPDGLQSTTPSPRQRESAFDARRRRKAKGASQEPTPSPSRTKNNRRNEKLPEDEYDPYDSDPGESYRDHCTRMKGDHTRSCLTMPRFLKQTKEIEMDTVATSPPSPLTSEIDDYMRDHNTPASLPRDLARARYSLRTSIGDGTAAQPSGASVMDRRELRPNNIHINTSHWSEFGGRAYMEDR
jgi:hypothetical protein